MAMKAATSIRFVWLSSLLLLAGCCDKAVLERCKAEAAQRQALVARPAIIAANGPMRFKVKSASDVAVGVELVRASCVGGKGGGAEVKVSWEVARAGLAGVRVRVGAAGTAEKVWMESGPKGEGVTGPWIGDGALLRLSDSYDDSLLAVIRVAGLPCGGGAAE
jgi:hypothetical protein